jgi:hypothetical protein
MKMIWKVRAVEAWPTDDENEYEFPAPIMGTDGHEVQILDFSPAIELGADEEMPPVVVYAFPDRSEP